jgi:UPF0755 protein
MKQFLFIFVVLCVICAGAAEWAAAVWTAPALPTGHGPQNVVVIAPHTPVHQVAQQLEDAHLLKYALAFEINLRLRGLAPSIKAGEYAVPSGASMADIAAILVSGKVIQHKLTIPEGLTSAMIRQLVSDDPDLTGDPGPVPQEGSMLPETYLFTHGMTRLELLQRMARAQRKFLDETWPGRDPSLPYANARDAVILASVIEKETALPDERRHIASVFLNRLKRGIKLQSDPTIIYGLTKGVPLGHSIRQSELESHTPYNTYVIDGLPPGPIANPGKDSLAAALKPDAGDDLYFVADGKGRSMFASTIAQHARNVMAFRAQERLNAMPRPEPQIPPLPGVNEKKKRP